MRCSKCGHILSEEYLNNKKKQKSDRIKLARKLARENGELVGAKIRINRAAILALLKQGYSVRKCASMLNCSTTPIMTVKKWFLQ